MVFFSHNLLSKQRVPRICYVIHVNSLLICSEAGTTLPYGTGATRNRPFAVFDHMEQKPPCWRANYPLGHPKQKNIKLSCFVLDVPVGSLLSSMALFVPRDRKLQRAYYGGRRASSSRSRVWKDGIVSAIFLLLICLFNCCFLLFLIIFDYFFF